MCKDAPFFVQNNPARVEKYEISRDTTVVSGIRKTLDYSTSIDLKYINLLVDSKRVFNGI